MDFLDTHRDRPGGDVSVLKDFTGLSGFAMLLLPAIALFIAAPATAGNERETRTERIDLSAIDWYYRIGDDATWKDRDVDMTGWEPVALPGVLPVVLESISDKIVWFRAKLPKSRIPDTPGLAVLLGRIQEADETFVNGVRIGGTGVILATALDYVGVGSSHVTRVYEIPPHALSGPGPLVLALRVQSVSYAPGPTRGPILIGDTADLTRVARGEDLPIWVRDGLWLTVLFMGFCVSLASVYGDGRDERNKWLPPFLASAAIGAAPHTILGFEAGMAAPLFIWVFDFSPYVLFGFLHVANSIGTVLNRFQWSMMFVFYVLQAFMVIADVTVATMYILSESMTLCVMLTACVSIYQSLRAYFGRVPVSVWTYLALGIVIASLIASTLLRPIVPAVLDPLNIGILVSVGCFLLAMADHNRWDRMALKRMAADLLVAQENERERIARELHDGVNQRLAVIRFRLERLARSGKALTSDALATPIDELRDTARDVSGLVEGLRPPGLEEAGFVATVTQAAQRWSAIGDVCVDLNVAGERIPADSSQLHLFRILQEAVHNALRHGKAATVSIDIDLTGNVGTLLVVDNGAGFDLPSTPSGVGLTAMRERVSLFNGSFDLASTVGKGTEIRIEFPVE